MLAGDDAYKFVPESKINPSADQIKEMLDKHKFIYLKPTAGSLGIGIFRVTYNPKRGYFVRYRKGGKTYSSVMGNSKDSCKCSGLDGVVSPIMWHNKASVS